MDFVTLTLAKKYTDKTIKDGIPPEAIENAVDEYLANNPIQVEEKDPTVPDWAKQPTKPKYTADEVGAVATVNGIAPDANGNVQIEIPETSQPDMTGYATERYVQENYQPKGNYLTEVPEDYAKTEDIPTKPEDIGAQPAGNYLTEVPSGYATEEFVKNKIAEAELGGEEVDLSGYAQKSELPTKVSELENDAGYLTEHQDLSDYAKKTELPVVPVQSVNGKTGSVKLSASDVGARPNTWMPTAQDVGALPSTYTPPNQTAEQVGADPKGTAENAVSQHNTSDDAHNDIRLELKAISDRLTAFFDSDNQTLDELSEIVAYITSNKTLIDSITASKVSVTDIINNLTTNVTNKPLSAAQGVALKALIDAITIPTKVSQLTNDKGYLTQHQDISGKLDASALPTAINTALAQAKASGEFDGKDGYTPVKGVDYFDGAPGKDGVDGKDGAKGDKGDKGDTGAQGNPGKDGTDGKDGANGKDGVSATHSWNGTTLTITSASGTSSANLKGEKGEKGDKGDQGIQGEKGATGADGKDGANGTSVTVKSVSESTTDGGSNVVTFSDGKTLTIKNGSKGSTGSKGDKGEKGATGQRGTGLLSVTTAPSSYTTAVGGITPKYRMALSTIKTQAGVTEVLLGDTVRYSYYQYPIDYLDSSYAYFTERISIRGATGAAGADGKDYSFDPTVYGLPVLELTGDTSPIAVSKDNKVTLTYTYGDRSGSCTLKGQGATSYKTAQALVNAGKKGKFNYTIKFDNAFEAKEGWSAQQKYCLKANFIDTTHSRNICSCKLWGMSVKARSTVPSQLAGLPNGGAIDGFPIIIMLNGEFHGLYTWNIPKDGWMFGLVEDTTKTQAIVGADDHTAATQFKEASMSGFEVEFVSDEDNADWVNTSITRLISAVMNSDGSDLDTTVAQYLDWDSAIDHYIHTVVDKAMDCVDKNYLLVTFDGVKWYMSAYDRDSIHGLNWNASGTTRPVSNVNFIECAETVRVYELIKRFKTDALKARYKQLRSNVLSESRIMEKFENFAWAIPSPVMLEDVKLYPTIKGSGVNTIDQIGRFVRQRLVRCDEWIDALPAQETPVEPEQPVEMVNLVPTSTDTDGSIYNGTGYKDNARLSSSGGVSSSAQNGSVVTGFMPWVSMGTIRIKGARWMHRQSEHYYINLYDSSKTFMYGVAAATAEADDGSAFSAVENIYDAATGVTTVDVSAVPAQTAIGDAFRNAAYFRINAYGKGADLIVTVNEEIT